MAVINQTAAISSNLGGILILVSLLISSGMLRQKTKIMRLLLLMFIISIIGCATDMLFTLVNGKLFFGSILINYLSKTFNNLETVIAGLLFIWFVNLRRDSNFKWHGSLKAIALLILVVTSLCSFLNPLTHIVFTIDKNNVYVRGPGGQMGFIIAMGCVLYTVIIVLKDNMLTKDYLPFPILQFVFPFVVGGGLQLLFSSFRLSNVSFALSLLTVYFNFLITSGYEDEMPGVYNEQYLSYFFSRTNKLRRMAAYGGISFTVREDLIYKLADALKINKKSGALLIRYKSNGILLLKENADLDEMERIIQEVRVSFGDDSLHIETKSGVYFSNSSENEYFLRLLKIRDIPHTV